MPRNNSAKLLITKRGLLAINKKSGKVIEWDEDEGSGDVLAESFYSYLEDYRNSLLGGKFEFLDDVGVIEKVSSGTRISRK